MANSPIDYAAVRSDLIARRAELDDRRKELDAAIAAVEKIIVSGIANTLASPPPAPQEHAQSPKPLPDTIFREMTIVEASVMYLQSIKRPQNAKEIAEALKRGGYVFQSKDPSNTVNAVLYRASAKDLLKRLGSAVYAANDPVA